MNFSQKHFCYFVFSFFSLYYFPTSASKTTDSLEQKLIVAKDSNRVKILILLCQEYSESNPKMALNLGEQALTLSQKIGYPGGTTHTLIKLANVHAILGDNTRSFVLYEQALRLAQENSNERDLYDIYVGKGDIYLSSGNYDTAYENFNAALKLAEQLKKEDQILPLNSIATIFYYQSKYDRALEYYFKSLKVAEGLSKKEAISQALLNIGSVYHSQNYYDKALSFYQQALKINEELNDGEEIANSLNNIGMILEKKKKYDQALGYYLRALKLKEDVGNKDDLESISLNIGNVYLRIANYSQAIEYYNRSLKLAAENGNKSDIAKNNFNIGSVYAEEKDYEKALNYLSQGLLDAKDAQRKDILMACYEKLGDVYAKRNDYKSAYENHKLYASIKDSILNEQTNKNVAELQTKYETDKKEKEIALQKSELSRQAVVRNAFIVGCILLFFIVFLTYNRYRIKQKGNELLTAINNELETLSLVASETHNGVMICEGDGTLVYMNRGIYRILGYTLDEVKKLFGMRLQDFSHNPQIDLLIEKALTEKVPVYYESINVAKSGQEIWIATTLTPIVNESGNISKIVVIDVDIHDTKLKSLQIEDQSREIRESINYARRIQTALLPDMETVKRDLPNSFVLYKPKAVVSGDFYWYNDWLDNFVIAAIDCTGHGVPGAFMSVMAHNILFQIASTSIITKPGYILENVHETVRASLKQNKINSESRDGMDMAMCRITKDLKKLEFAGAMRSLYHIRNNVLTEIKGDKHAIGGYQSEEFRKFKTHIIDLEKDDCIYIFTDGYADQFGGHEGKKFMTKRMKNLLVSISFHSMEEQHKILEKTFEEWKGNREQIDDVLVIGIKV